MRTAEMLRETHERQPDKLALTFGDQQWTYTELDEVTDRVGAGLAAAGVHANDRVAFWMPNCPELFFSYLACFKIGAIAVPLNHRYKLPEARYAIEHSGATTLILHTDKLPEISALPLAELGLARGFLVAGSRGAQGDTAICRGTELRRFAELLETAEKLPAPTFGPRQLATIIYTSGTTSRPKGVVQSQESLWNCARIQTASMQFTAEDVLLVTTSASHCAATFGFLFPNLFAGGVSVLLDAPTPAEVAAAITRRRVTRCQMLPPELLDLVEYLEEHPTDVSSLRSVQCGGDVVPRDTLDRFRAVVGFDVSELVGMTETITYCANPPFGEKRLGSVGLPAVDTEIKIIDPHGNELPRGETGEIHVRSGSNMVGYWNDTLNTVATICDGWVATGDLGRIDNEGYLWFVGRQKEIIIRGGSNISPLEVEEVIDQHPSVHNSGVVGFADRRLGQVVVAYVSLRHGATSTPDEAELRKFVAERLAAYKTPERFFLLEELPLGPTGKVDRRELHRRLPRDMGKC